MISVSPKRASGRLVPCGLPSGYGPARRGPEVGGERGGALVVRVSPRAVDGQATEAALAAVAAAFGLRRRAVTLVAGASSRTKILEVEGADPTALSRLLAEAGQL